MDETVLLQSEQHIDKLESHPKIDFIEILGSPILLNHWLMVLGDKIESITYQEHNGRFLASIGDGIGFYFNKDGQPLYESDYKSICNLLDI